MNKLYLNGKEIAIIESVAVVDDLCIIQNILFHEVKVSLYDPRGFEVYSDNVIVKGCAFTFVTGAFVDPSTFSISMAHLTYTKHIIIKKEKDDHSGQIYNAYTDTWSWL